MVLFSRYCLTAATSWSWVLDGSFRILQSTGFQYTIEQAGLPDLPPLPHTRCPVLVLLQRTNDSLQIYVDFSMWTYFVINIWSIGWSTDEHTAIHFKTLYHLMPNTLGHSSSTSQERCTLWDQSSNFVKVPMQWSKITTPVEAKVTKLKAITMVSAHFV